MMKIVKDKQRVKKSQCPSVGTEVKISSSERFESIWDVFFLLFMHPLATLYAPFNVPQNKVVQEYMFLSFDGNLPKSSFLLIINDRFSYFKCILCGAK